jgi:hypothetical protein
VERVLDIRTARKDIRGTYKDVFGRVTEILGKTKEVLGYVKGGVRRSVGVFQWVREVPR